MKIYKFDWLPTDKNLTKYDIKSIMHYDGTLNGWFPENNPVMKGLDGSKIEVNKELSPLDIEKLNKMYPCQQTSPACGKYFQHNL